MKRKKKERLAKAGWQVGSAKDFLGPNKAETALTELDLAWGDEAERRAHALRSGQVAPILAAKAKSKARSRLK
jgi:hypothetical protein